MNLPGTQLTLSQFVLALSNFEGTFYKYAKLAEMSRKQTQSEEDKSGFK